MDIINEPTFETIELKQSYVDHFLSSEFHNNVCNFYIDNRDEKKFAYKKFMYVLKRVGANVNIEIKASTIINNNVFEYLQPIGIISNYLKSMVLTKDFSELITSSKIEIFEKSQIEINIMDPIINAFMGAYSHLVFQQACKGEECKIYNLGLEFEIFDSGDGDMNIYTNTSRPKILQQCATAVINIHTKMLSPSINLKNYFDHCDHWKLLSVFQTS